MLEFILELGDVAEFLRCKGYIKYSETVDSAINLVIKWNPKRNNPGGIE